MSLTLLKWGSTFLVLTGILIAQFNIYPLYIFKDNNKGVFEDSNLLLSISP